MEREKQRVGRLDRPWFALRKDSHHSVPRTLGKLDNKESSKQHSPAHSLDRLVSLHRSSEDRPRRPSRLDFVNSNDVFVLERNRKRLRRPNSPEKCEQECLCELSNAPRKYEEIGNPALTWAFKDKCDDFHARIEPEPELVRSDCLEKPSPIHSDDGNSPTALNTSRLLTDKPPLVKTLHLDYTDPGFNSLRRQRDTCEKVRLHRDPQSSLPPIPTNLTNGRNSTPPPSGDCGQRASMGDLPPELADLRTAPWFQAGLPREAALLLLSRQPEGSFLVRCSTSQPGSLALSLRVPCDIRPCGLAHYLIVKSPRGYRIKGFAKEFGSVRSLVIHHSVMPELLPVPLSLARPQQNRDESGNFADLSEPEYNTIADFRKLIADLHV